MDCKFIAYYRVSTGHQGVNGNGMVAQRKAVEDYLNGGCWKLVGEFTEVESGKRSDRPELEKALKACRKHKDKASVRIPPDSPSHGCGHCNLAPVPLAGAFYVKCRRAVIDSQRFTSLNCDRERWPLQGKALAFGE
jgi:hypothetical protein